MGRRARAWGSATLTVALLSGAACTDAGAEDPPTAGASTGALDEPSTPDTASPSPSEDSFAIPDEITEEYVQRVLDELMRIRAEAVRAALELDPYPEDYTDLPPSVTDPLNAIYGPTEELFQAAFVHFTASAPERARLRPDYERVRYLVNSVSTRTDQCLVFSAVVDNTGALGEPSETMDQVHVTLKLDEASGTDNPTRWVIDSEEFSTDPLEIGSYVEGACS